MGDTFNAMEHIILRFEFQSEEETLLLDFTSLLYDFELFHDLVVMSNLDEYQEYLRTPTTWMTARYGTFWIRTGRPLRHEHRLKVIQISRQSPWQIALGVGIAVAASKALVPLVDGLGKIRDWQFNRAKARSEAEKAQFEAEEARLKAEKAGFERDTAYIIREREQRQLENEELVLAKENAENRIRKRLEKNPMKLTGLSIISEYTVTEDKK